MRRPRPPLSCLALALIAGATPAARAQNAAPGVESAAPREASREAAKEIPPAPGPEIERRADELKGLEKGLEASEAARRKLEADIEQMRADRARLNAALIETAQRVQAAETRASEAEARLETLNGAQEAIRRSLEARRGLISEVLAAVQRMGRRPPPAILAEPDDMLRAIRSAMTLGAVLPQLREETAALAADLEEMTRLRKSIDGEKTTLAREIEGLGQERQRLASLLDERKTVLSDAEKALQNERDKARELARQATSLKDLIQRMEAEVGSSARAAAEARRSDEAQKSGAADEVRAKLAAALTRDPARLSPAIPFAEAKGKLGPPVAGRLARAFGAPDGFGGVEKAAYFRARSGATVVAPADGWVSFAGSWRNWGQVLILNAGGGYYVVLAGLERVNVEMGQFVLAGEPVGAMGAQAQRTAAALAIGGSEPILYVEFRKDGASIDPSPWWAKQDVRQDMRQDVRQDSEKARG
jgi:septal ring factor EnvC (AmiA/AmiB activator)